MTDRRKALLDALQANRSTYEPTGATLDDTRRGFAIYWLLSAALALDIKIDPDTDILLALKWAFKAEPSNHVQGGAF